jgi:predicted ATP-grasp superfamily ATP-dependent carboligase
VLLLQLFNLQIDNQALERRAQMLQEKQEKLAALERALIAAQEEVSGGA